MSAKAIIRRPGEGKSIKLAGHPMVFLVTGNDTRHTSMFEWTIPAGFATGLHVHRVQEETFYVLDGECEWRGGRTGDPRNTGDLSVHPAWRAAQHHQCQRQAGARAYDRLSAGARTLFRRACGACR